MDSNKLALLSDAVLKQFSASLKQVAQAYDLKFERLENLTISFGDASGDMQGTVTVSKVDDSTQRYEVKAQVSTDTFCISFQRLLVNE